jgi:hypothetical protein
MDTQLTTPKTAINDPSCPGENWFLYWKTSRSLWRSKMEMLTPARYVFVPIHWGQHFLGGDNFDFGKDRPETELHELEKIAKSLGREIIFLLPIGPCPLMSSGGLPLPVCRYLAKNTQNIHRVYCDTNEELVKMYSFYDPRVYKLFTAFVHQLAHYFHQNGISSSLMGMVSWSIESHGPESFLQDTSQSFDQGFKKFLEVQIEERGISGDGVHPNEYTKLQADYQDLILNLYSDFAMKKLHPLFQGIWDVNF